MTVRLVTISVKSSPTLLLHEPIIMGESFYSLLPYLCSGYPRLAPHELAFYHAYSGGWRDRCGIPACHLLVGSFMVYIAELWGVISVHCACALSWSHEKSSRSVCQSLEVMLLMMHDDGELKTLHCISSVAVLLINESILAIIHYLLSALISLPYHLNCFYGNAMFHIEPHKPHSLMTSSVVCPWHTDY